MLDHIARGLLTVTNPPREPRYLAYWLVGDWAWIAARLDPSGAVIAFIGEPIEGPVDPPRERAAPILFDQSGLVSAGALIVPGSDGLFVFDFVAGVRHQWTPGPLDMAGGAYVDGHVLALTHERTGFGTTSRVDLVRLATDLSTSQTLASVELAPEDITGATFFKAVSAAIAADRAWIAVEWVEHEASYGTQAAVLQIDGSSVQGPAPLGEAAGPSGLGLPYAPGGAVRQRFRWEGSLEGWDVWAPGLAGDEGGPGASDIVTVYDVGTAALLEADLSNPGAEPTPITLPAAEHADFGVLGPPVLVFPDF